MYYGERLNSITHLVGAAFSLIGWGALCTVSLQHGDPWMIISFNLFGISLVLLYTMSTLYHSFSKRFKSVFQKFDYISIYLLIAGSYTPYVLVTLRDKNGWWLFVAEWTLACIGIFLDCLPRHGKRWLQLCIYLVMGWLIILDWTALNQSLSSAGIYWLIAGGLAYTFGVIFYMVDEKIRCAHGVWHLFVMAGSACIFVSILGFVR